MKRTVALMCVCVMIPCFALAGQAGTATKPSTRVRLNPQSAALGDGEVPLDIAVNALKEAGYDGAYCAEYEGSEDGDIGYRKCLDWLRANV